MNKENAHLRSIEQKILSWDTNDPDDLIDILTLRELFELANALPQETFERDFDSFGACVSCNARSFLYRYTWNWLNEMGADRSLCEDPDFSKHLLDAAIALSC